MIGNSFGEYVFIRISILALRSITPLSFLYCLVFFIFRPQWLLPYRLSSLFEIWIVLEVLFYLFVYVPLKVYLQRETSHFVLPPRSERQALFQKCLENTPDLESYLRRWFLLAPFSDIKRENVKEFLAWALLNKKPGQLWEEEEDELDEDINRLETFLGINLPEGKGDAKPICLSFDPVNMLHRCLLWYLIIGIVEIMTSIRLLLASWHFHRQPISHFFTNFPFRPLALLSQETSPSTAISYWHRPHTSKTRLPILFIHGIGIGLHPYVDFFNELVYNDLARAEDGDIGIIAVEIMPISARICSPALTSVATRNEIRKILRKHGWDEFVLMANSYGTAIAANILQDEEFSRSIKSLVLIDPVCLLLFLPDVAYNFTRRPPTQANEYMLHYFASTDMMTAHTLARHFFWSEHVLWKEDLFDIPTTVCLGGRDLIVNTGAVWQYLTGTSTTGERPSEWADEHGLDILWFEELDHAQVFDKKSARRAVANAVRKKCLGTTANLTLL